MAQGTDLYFCQAVLDLRQAHPDVTIEAAVPFAGQADRWPAADQARRLALLDQCDLETVVQHTYTPGCMGRRNRYMVDRSSLLLAVYDGTPRGGTMNTWPMPCGRAYRPSSSRWRRRSGNPSKKPFPSQTPKTARCQWQRQCTIWDQGRRAYRSRLKILKISL